MMPIRKLRVISCAAAVLVTLEVCARIDDRIRYGVPFTALSYEEMIWGSDEIGRTGVPNASYHEFQLNNLGYRSPALRPGTLRILCIGASETWGTANTHGHEYPRQLERMLNESLHTQSIEVVNLGMPSENAAQERQRMPQIIDRLHPDIVLFYPAPVTYGWAAVQSVLKSGRRAPGAARTPAPLSLPRRIYVRARNKADEIAARCYKYLRFTVFKNIGSGPELFRMEAKIGDLEFHMQPEAVMGIRARVETRFRRWRISAYFPRVADDAAPLFREDMAAMADELDAHGIRTVLVQHANSIVLPRDADMLRIWNSYYPYTDASELLRMEDRLNDMVAEVAHERNLPLIDARVIPKERRYFSDFVHFTDEGAILMAKLLADRIQPLVAEELTRRASTASSVPR